MTALELYKFIEEKGCEYNWSENNNHDDVLLFVDAVDAKELAILLGNTIFDDEGIICHWKGEYFCIWMQDVCDYFGIEIKDVFKIYAT